MISNREMSLIPAETEVRLRLSCHFTVITAVFVLGQHMGKCKSDLFKSDLKYKINIIY